jgi:D-3-phosphoglycerate dehydrogenase
MNVLVTDPISTIGIDILRRQCEVDVRLGLEPEQLKSIIHHYDALIVRSETKVTSDIIKAAKNLQVIGRAGVGIDNIDVDSATLAGIMVVNSPEGNIISTAEHTIAMLLALARQIPKADNLLHSGAWNRQFKAYQIRNKILGIIGLGRVGTEVAQLAKGLHMNIVAYDPMISEVRASKLGVRLVKLEELLAMSDFITIHVPLNASTKGLIGSDQLRLMKPTALVVNCARGGIINEEALNDALNQGQLAGAAIDVFSKEPAYGIALLKNEKVVATPHLAASTLEAQQSASKDIAEQVVAILTGHMPTSPVNAPMILPEVMSIMSPYIQIGRTIGKVAVQLVEGHPTSVSIRYEGDIAKEDTRPIKAAILSGLLEMSTDERVNIVNADIVAEKRGLNIKEQKNTICENYSDMIVCQVNTEVTSTLVGASLLRNKTYLTRVNDYWLEIEPSGNHMLFTEHKDRPGMIGEVGSIIGNAGINISQMQVCLDLRRGGKAMMALCLDDDLPPACYKRIASIPGMYKAFIVEILR